jgi:hypothetical protein
MAAPKSRAAVQTALPGVTQRTKQAGQHFEIRVSPVKRERPCQICREPLIVGDYAEVRENGGAHIKCGVAQRRGGLQ